MRSSTRLGRRPLVAKNCSDRGVGGSDRQERKVVLYRRSLLSVLVLTRTESL